MPTFHSPSVRFAWALLASLLIHLALIGNMARLDWWQTTQPGNVTSPLEIQLSPTPGENKLPTAKERIRPLDQPTPTPQEEPELSIPAPSPIVEKVISIDPAEEKQDESPAVSLETPPSPIPPEPINDQVAQRLPPSGKLIYKFYWGEARWLAGQAVHQWVIEKGSYTLSSTVTTTGLVGLFRPIKLVETAQGIVVGGRLRPLKFTSQWNENPAAVSLFVWDKGYFLWSRGNASFTQPLSPNSYDKISYLYQLYISAQKEDFFSPDITLGRRLEHYDIQDLGTEELEIDGEIQLSIHLKRATSSPEMENIDIWLSTTRNNLPIKMTYSNKSGDHYEQLISLDSIPVK